MRKGTIVYVGNFELPDKGAAANRVVSNGKVFEKAGYRTVYLGINKELKTKHICVLDEKAHMYEEAYPQGSKEWLAHIFSTRKIQELVSRYEDVCMIILYNLPFLLLTRTKKAFKNTGIKVVYDCTEWTPVTDGSAAKRMVKRVDEYFIRNHIGDTADGLIVISKMMEKQYAACKNMIRIPPLIDMNDGIWYQNVQKKKNNFEFCFAGLLDGNKDSLDIIVEAFLELKQKDCVLRIIGVEEQEFYDFYPQLHLKMLQQKEQILFMGRLSHAETVKYVQNSDCYIFIRQSDLRNNAGFPTKFVEAYTCGIPMIATDISDLREYMRNGQKGQLLESTSKVKVKEAMLKELNKKQSVSRSEERLEDTFHYETYADRCKHWLDTFEN